MRISVQEAGALLKRGDVVAVPTETVYGLAASLSHEAAISRIFSLKGRPADNPLIIHLEDAKEIKRYALEVAEDYERLAKAFWPGPMTLVIPVIPEKVPSIVRAGLPTAAFRVPAHPLTRELLGLTGPLVMPSANLSGRPSSTCVEHVEEDFGKEFPVLDGGECLQGVESTILMFRDGKWAIIRLGVLSPEIFEDVLGFVPEVKGNEEGKSPICPGQLYRHYAPKAKLRLSGVPQSGDVIIGFSDRHYPEGCRVLALGVSSDPIEAAHRLYAVLRQLDEEDIEQAWIDMSFPREGLWLTLRERLQKAAL